MTKKRISRKELLDQSDEFITQTQRVFNFVSEHPKKIILGASIVLAVVIAIFGIKFYFDYNARQALAAYDQAMLKVSKLKNLDSKSNGEEVEAALDALERVSTMYSRTAPGRQALFDLGTLYFHLKQYNQAIFTYKKGLNAFKPEEEALRPFILDSLAYAYEAQDKLNEAAARWEEIIQLPGELLKEQAFFSLGRIYAAMNQPEKSRNAYQQLVDRFPNSPNLNLARFKLKKTAQGKSE